MTTLRWRGMRWSRLTEKQRVAYVKDILKSLALRDSDAFADYFGVMVEEFDMLAVVAWQAEKPL